MRKAQTHNTRERDRSTPPTMIRGILIKCKVRISKAHYKYYATVRQLGFCEVACYYTHLVLANREPLGKHSKTAHVVHLIRLKL